MKNKKIESEENYDECLAIYQAVKYNKKGDKFHNLKMELVHLIEDYEKETDSILKDL